VKRGEKRWLDDAADPGRRALRQAMDETRPAEDQIARQRVWAAVHAPWGQARPRWWPALAAVGGAAAMVVAGLLLFQPRDRVVSAPERPPVTGSLPIADTPARQRLARGVDVELSSRAALVPGDEATPPEVQRGRVRFSVPHQPPGQRYAVRAGAYRITVLGTVFDVAVEGSAVRVSVSSGVVQIEEAASGNRLDRVAAGEEWSSPKPEPKPELRPEPEPARAMPAHRTPAPPADPAALRALAEARGARRSGDPRRALDLYERIAAAGGPLAESALFEMASIENEDLHDAARALATWQRYRDRYPRGLLRAEADLSVIEVLPRLGQEGRALDEARAFLRRYPRSERRAEVARVAGDLARTRGDCRAALPLFELALAAGVSGRDADDAAFGRAACLANLGDARASEAARDYLRRFPAGRHVAEVAQLAGR
jgi:hypothetical protein